MDNASWAKMRPQWLRLSWRWGWGLMAAAIAIVIIGLRSPAYGYEVQIIPPNPELGDTISVVVTPANPNPNLAPTVVVKGQEYPTYPLSGNRYRALIPTSPVDTPGRVVIQVVGEEDTRNLAVGLRNRNFPTQRITLPPDRAGLEGTDYEFRRLGEFRALRTPDRYWDSPFVRPSTGAVSTVYGVRRYYNGVFAEDYYHRGVDYTAGNGSPIVAPAAGRIVVTGRVEDGFVLNGNTVAIDHGQGVGSVMIHLSRIDVQEGDFVQPGQRIGAMGSTGFATGPNLHWGLYVNGVAVDPVPWRNSSIE